MSDQTQEAITNIDPIDPIQVMAENLGYDQVAVIGWDENTGCQHVSWYGSNAEHRESARKGANIIMKAYDFPEHLRFDSEFEKTEFYNGLFGINSKDRKS